MKKKVAKVFEKYGDGKVKILKKYRAKSFEKGKTTTAIKASRRDLNHCIAKILMTKKEAHRIIVAKAMSSDFYEDWDNGEVIKY